ncbi:MAG: hypothetical protein ACI8PT_004974 [Gammaproteobacteria bacterium]|jgi:hypothetical protein
MRHHNTTRISLPIALIGAATFALVAGTVRAQTPAPTVQSLTQTKPQRLLFVGNSYLYYGDSVHNHVRRMVIAAGLHEKKQLKYKSATISGSAIFDHNIDSYLEPGKLRVKEPFQVVILQGGSAAPWRKGRDIKFRETVAEFSKKITAAGGETALYMTHAYVQPHKRFDPDMIDAIAKLYVTTGNATGSLVIPVGLAFEEAYRRRPGGQFHKPFDGSHPNLLGTYLAASVVFGSLYDESPVGNPYDYFGKLSKDDIAFLQTVAQDTVTKFYGR